ncbi:MAG: hypothetical protein KDD63_23485, partial [Bacteroidetes bacterium]|nr:hypothetical protein [Bacteroidota bacterium]
PLDDHTPGGNIYMFTETSSGALGDTFTLSSPCMDFAGVANPRLAFWYHMYGATIGSLHVRVTTSGGFDSFVTSIIGQQQTAETDPWIEEIVNLDWAADSLVVIDFIGVRGSSFTGDLAIDDINIFSAQPIDALVSEIPPLPSVTCGFSAAEPISVVVKNLGFTTLDTIPVAYSINGGTPVIDTLFATLLSTDTTLFTFSQLANLSMAGATYTIQAWTSVPGDGTVGNDTTTYTVTNPLLLPPLIEDFETWTVGSPGTVGFGWTIASTSTATAASAGWHVEQDGVANSGGTGPIDDHTQGGMIYMFTETSSGAVGDTFELISPCIDLSVLSQPKLSFWYHMYGAAMGTLQAVVRSDTGDAVVWSLSGQQQTAENDPWLEAVVNLSGFNNISNTKLVFRGIRGTTFTSDMAIDDINIYEPSDYDVAAGPVVSPLTGCG